MPRLLLTLEFIASLFKKLKALSFYTNVVLATKRKCAMMKLLLTTLKFIVSLLNFKPIFVLTRRDEPLRNVINTLQL